MLQEILNTRQIAGESRRRWFTSSTMDLIVWSDVGGALLAFQFCYDKGRAEQAVSWKPQVGLSHMAVDDGEGFEALRYKAAPMLLNRDAIDFARVQAMFEGAARELPGDIAAFVMAKLAPGR
jgi:hypothetical protein